MPPIFIVEAPVAAVVKLTSVLADEPMLIVFRFGIVITPFVEPSIAVVNITLSTGKVPIFCTVMVVVTVPRVRCNGVDVTTSLTPPQGDGPAVKLVLTVPKSVTPSSR